MGYNDEIRWNAQFMLMTMAGYFVIALPSTFLEARVLNHKLEGPSQEKREATGETLWSFIALVFCFVEFTVYLYYEFKRSGEADSSVDDKIATTHVSAIKQGNFTLRAVLAQFRESGSAMTVQQAMKSPEALDNIRRFCKVLAPFFAMYDVNGDNRIDLDEFRMILVDIGGNMPKETATKMFLSADVDNSNYISFEEFVACLMSYAYDESNDLQGDRRKRMPDPNRYFKAMDEEEGEDEEEEEDDEEDIPEDLADLEPEEQQRVIKRRAAYTMGAGTVLVLLFADPMVDIMNEMGKRVHLSAFYISFVLAPIASNASELVAAYNYAQKRTIKSMTTSLSTLEGAGVMNNTFTFAMLLVIMCIKGVYWDFNAEIIVVVIVETLIGLPMLLNKKRQLLLRDAVISTSYYPLTLILVAFLNYKLNLD